LSKIEKPVSCPPQSLPLPSKHLFFFNFFSVKVNPCCACEKVDVNTFWRGLSILKVGNLANISTAVWRSSALKTGPWALLSAPTGLLCRPQASRPRPQTPDHPVRSLSCQIPGSRNQRISRYFLGERLPTLSGADHCSETSSVGRRYTSKASLK